MRPTIRIALIVGLVGYFGLVPEITYSFYQDSWSQLSNWHPSDEVPCMWHYWGIDLVTVMPVHECVTVLERPNIIEIADAR